MVFLDNKELRDINGGHDDCAGAPEPTTCSVSYQAGHSVGYIIGEAIEGTGDFFRELYGGWRY